MALYISAGRRRRRAVIVAAIVGVLAFGAGILVGRQQVPSIDSRVASVAASADDIATGVERLDIEYEQVLAGGDTLEQGVLTPFDELRRELQHNLDRAPWVAASQRSTLLDSLAAARQSAVDGDTLDAFRTHLRDTAALVRSVFGVA